MAASKICRTGDIGIGTCPAHNSPVTYTTIFVSSNPNTTDYGYGIITVGDIGICSCGHTTIALAGAQFGDANGKKIHRVGDPGTNPGPYVAMTGSPTSDSV